MALGKRVRALREQRGWTLEYLEEVSGVPVGTISALEVRNSKRSVYASALAKAFGVTLEELLEDERLLELPKTPRAPALRSRSSISACSSASR